MQTDNCKNQNTQLPDQVAAVPVKTTCLLEGAEHSACSHRGCYLLTHKSKYYQSIAVWYDKYDFTHFDIDRSKNIEGKIWLMPHNPFDNANPISKNNFEIYRQAMNSVIDVKGPFPENIKTIGKEDIAFKLFEVEKIRGVWNPETLQNDNVTEIDVEEFAVYVGEKGGRQC